MTPYGDYTARQDRAMSVSGGGVTEAARKVSHNTQRDVVLLNIMSAAWNEINFNRLEITNDDVDDKHNLQSIQCDSPSMQTRPFIHIYDMV